MKWSFADKPLILASKSAARQALLNQAGIAFEVAVAAIDEPAIRAAAEAEGASADDIAVLLAEMKGERIAANHPEAMIIASDQLLVCDGRLFGKPRNLEEAKAQLAALSGKRHQLVTAVILFDKSKRIWHHIARPEITFHDLDEALISDYLAFFGDEALHSPGSYFLEGPGIHLFSDIFGDYYAILGLPMMALLPQLKLHGLKLLPDESQMKDSSSGACR